MPPRLVLVVEPEDSLARLFDRALRLDGWSVYHVGSFSAAMRRLDCADFDLVCCEYDAEAGLDALAVQRVFASRCGRPFIITSVHEGGALVARFLGTPFLRQPFTIGELDAVFHRAMSSVVNDVPLQSTDSVRRQLRPPA